MTNCTLAIVTTPGNQVSLIVAKCGEKLGLNGEVVHVEAIGGLEKVAAMADREARCVFDKPGKLDIVSDKLVEVSTESRLRHDGTWLNQN